MKKTLTDEQLVRFLDGQFDAEKTREIEHRLKTDPDLAAQLDALSLDINAIREAFDRALPLAPTVDLSAIQINERKEQMLGQTPEQARSVATDNRRFTRLLPLAASVVGALGLGLLLGLNADRLFQKDSENSVTSWQQAVVDYQLLYVPGTLPAVAPDESEKRRQLLAISRVGGLSVTDAMTRLPGIDFRRAQTLGINGAPLIQIAFAGPDGEPFALCFMRIDQPASKPVARAIDGLNTVSWRNGEYGFILASSAKPEQLSAVADRAVELF